MNQLNNVIENKQTVDAKRKSEPIEMDTSSQKNKLNQRPHFKRRLFSTSNSDDGAPTTANGTRRTNRKSRRRGSLYENDDDYDDYDNDEDDDDEEDLDGPRLCFVEQAPPKVEDEMIFELQQVDQVDESCLANLDGDNEKLKNGDSLTHSNAITSSNATAAVAAATVAAISQCLGNNINNSNNNKVSDPAVGCNRLLLSNNNIGAIIENTNASKRKQKSLIVENGVNHEKVMCDDDDDADEEQQDNDNETQSVANSKTGSRANAAAAPPNAIKSEPIAIPSIVRHQTDDQDDDDDEGAVLGTTPNYLSKLEANHRQRKQLNLNDLVDSNGDRISPQELENELQLMIREQQHHQNHSIVAAAAPPPPPAATSTIAQVNLCNDRQQQQHLMQIQQLNRLQLQQQQQQQQQLQQQQQHQQQQQQQLRFRINNPVKVSSKTIYHPIICLSCTRTLVVLFPLSQLYYCLS